MTDSEIGDNLELGGKMLMVLARCGVIALTLFFGIWVVTEIMHREKTSKITMNWGNSEYVSNFKFGWKIGLAFILGIPSLTILWTLVI